MKKQGILNKNISQVIASMGHFDQITICDAGLPIPQTVQRIDLAIEVNLPRFLDVVCAIAKDLEVQRIYLAEELNEKNPALVKSVRDIFINADVVFIPHEELKAQIMKSRAIVRTGECSAFANVILESGVIF